MNIFNIYTVKNQDEYAYEEYAMILAHILEKGLYARENFINCKHIIMDNGVYEKAQVSTDLSSLISLANSCGILIDEIVIPDVIGNYEKSKELYQKNYQTMYAYRDDYQFMYVAHAQNEEQLLDAIDMVNREKYVKLVLGIPKHSQLDRTSNSVKKILKKCKVPIHFLGIKKSFEELKSVSKLIRSCDSVQLTYITRDYSIAEKFSDVLYNKPRLGNDINLLTDSVNSTKLKLMKTAINEELKKYGILR